MKRRFTFAALATLVLVAATALVAQAQANRTFVSGTDGTDAGNCLKTAPCKTLNYAQTVTNTAGEIVVTSADGVGQVTVTKALTIEAAPGAYGFVKAQPGTAGIVVNPGAGITVVLRNMQFGGQGGSNTIGVQHTSGTLVIANCIFQQLTTGAAINSTGGALIENSSFSGNGTGLMVTAGKVNVRKSTFTFNTTRGVHALTAGLINLQESQVSNNAIGITADGVGGCLSTNPQTPPTVIVRLELGSVTDNTLGFEMLNQGPACPNSGSGHGQNILVRNDGGTSSALTTNIVGNTTALNVSGQTSGNQVTLGQYQTVYFGNQP